MVLYDGTCSFILSFSDRMSFIDDDDNDLSISSSGSRVKDNFIWKQRIERILLHISLLRTKKKKIGKNPSKQEKTTRKTKQPQQQSNPDDIQQIQINILRTKNMYTLLVQKYVRSRICRLVVYLSVDYSPDHKKIKLDSVVACSSSSIISSLWKFFSRFCCVFFI